MTEIQKLELKITEHEAALKVTRIALVAAVGYIYALNRDKDVRSLLAPYIDEIPDIPEGEGGDNVLEYLRMALELKVNKIDKLAVQ